MCRSTFLLPRVEAAVSGCSQCGPKSVLCGLASDASANPAESAGCERGGIMPFGPAAICLSDDRNWHCQRAGADGNAAILTLAAAAARKIPCTSSCGSVRRLQRLPRFPSSRCSGRLAGPCVYLLAKDASLGKGHYHRYTSPIHCGVLGDPVIDT